ncbi:MAG: helix-turn-helix transcriptional regulator [Polyangiaceae bacterium]|nr:helix-turn-helix transcriptional regulator [Polyangiaceae bacterium]
MRLGSRDSAGLAALIAELGTLRLDGPGALALVVAPLEELLGAAHVFAYRFVPGPTGLALGEFHLGGAPLAGQTETAVRRAMNAWLGTQASTGQGPLRPAPRLRNRVLTRAGLEALVGPNAPSVRFLAQLGFGGFDQLRVNLCDGPLLLGHVGALRSAPFELRQRTLLARLVEPLCRRLAAERALREAPALRGGFELACEALPAPAFLLGADGAVHHANAAGHAHLAAEPDARRLLAEAARRGGDGRFGVTTLRTPGAPVWHFAVRRGQTTVSATGAVVGAGRAYGLTARQLDVLRLLVRGHTNAAISAELGISARTIEVHLSAMFEKAGVDSRSALVARVLSR